ncbi:MAG: phosphatase PAP2 family protein [Prevotella sp.]|jgi:membrane-associated phospholipid phosphatase
MTWRSLLLVILCTATLTLKAQKPYHDDGAGDWLRFVPVASAYALKACGVESASSWKRLTVNSALSVALSSGVVWGLKHTIHERRPDWTDNHSFPSGHTSIAFAGATILDKEFRHVSPWISVAGYAVATGIAIDRVARNKHHWQDVAVGAGLGVGGTLLGYWLGDKITGERSRYAVGIGADGVTAVVYL